MEHGTSGLQTEDPTPETAPRALLLVSADWSLPSRPAPTVLRELARRPGSPLRALLLEDPERASLDALGVTVLPTWMVLGPARAGGEEDGADGRPDEVTTSPVATDHVLTDLTGVDPSGEPARLSGPWRVLRRSEGALPKHAVAALLEHEDLTASS